MSYMIGIIVSLISVRGAMYFLDQNAGMYFDDVALSIVVGCTLAVSVIVLPWRQARTLFSRLWMLFFPKSVNKQVLLKECLNFVQSGNNPSYTPSNKKEMPFQILRDGKELLDLKFSTDEIESILQERVHQEHERGAEISAAFGNLAKYPPAFGLIGTVFGLVDLMRAISEGLDPTQTGTKMAIALVATLYGLVLANLVIAPIGELISKQMVAERHQADIALQSVLLASQKVSLLKSQELLNSFVEKNNRVNVIGGLIESGEAA